ncbi:hypothetical protein GCM10025876_41340 [Demequina litorisediminis]|uniref:Uncharacterized protein n=1 Tax=Demequina litorisediminis TaxID=1849022 RepID=A0ABQ6IJ45_9MICO|nr:hypothetical protein GCM10025876_41340 [Demequina litorisediminis]
MPVTWDVSVYYHGVTAPSSTSASPPARAELVGTARVTGTNGSGQRLTAQIGTATKAGYYVWVWSFDRESQPAVNRPYLAEGSDWADRYGLADETARARAFQPGGTSKVLEPIVSVGDRLVDTFTTSTRSGGALVTNSWLTTPGGTPVPATWDVTVYYAGMEPPARQNSVPSSAERVRSAKVTGSGGSGELLSVDLGAAAKAGYYVWVWEFNVSSQPARWQPYFAGDWADQYGLTDETITSRAFQPAGVSQVVEPEVAVGDVLADTFTTATQPGGPLVVDEWLTDTTGTPLPVTWDVTLYFHGTTPPVDPTIDVDAGDDESAGEPAPDVDGSAPPESVPAVPLEPATPTPVVVGQTQVTGTGGAGEVLTVELGTATKAGYYVWVWEFNVSSQPARWQPYFAGDWADQYGLTDETITSRAFQPAGVSQVVEPEVAVGDVLADTFTTATQPGGPLVVDEWLTDTTGTPLPVTWDVTLYFHGTTPPVDPVKAGESPNPAPSVSLSPEDVGSAVESDSSVEPVEMGDLVAETQVTGTGGAGEVLTVEPGTATKAGYYVWVWAFHVETQPEELRAYFAGDWADQYGLTDETTTSKAFQPAGVSQVVEPEVAVGDVLADTFTTATQPGGPLVVDEWLTDTTGTPLPVTWDVTLYFHGTTPPEPPAPSAVATSTVWTPPLVLPGAAPKGALQVGQTQVTGKGGAGEVLTVEPGHRDEGRLLRVGLGFPRGNAARGVARLLRG